MKDIKIIGVPENVKNGFGLIWYLFLGIFLKKNINIIVYGPY